MHLEIDSHSSNEEFARVTAAVFMSRMNPTMEELEDVKTAVSEAVTNAVIHGYSDEIGIIYIEARIEGEELIISVRDEGKGILDVEKAMEPMYTTDTTGERSGMGFSFMEAFMDEVEVESKVGCGTCVTMKKRIGREYMNKEQEEKKRRSSMDKTIEQIKRAHQGDKTAREALVKDNLGLVWSIVRRFAGRGVRRRTYFRSEVSGC